MESNNEIYLAVMEQIKEVEQGKKQSWTEGIRFNAQCDGKNHYLYKMDKSAINPKTGHGYSKGRIYAGTFDKARGRCPAYASNWQGRHKCRQRRVGDGHGWIEGHGNGGSSDIESNAPIRWEDVIASNYPSP